MLARSTLIWLLVITAAVVALSTSIYFHLFSSVNARILELYYRLKVPQIPRDEFSQNVVTKLTYRGENQHLLSNNRTLIQDNKYDVIVSQDGSERFKVIGVITAVNGKKWEEYYRNKSLSYLPDSIAASMAIDVKNKLVSVTTNQESKIFPVPPFTPIIRYDWTIKDGKIIGDPTRFSIVSFEQMQEGNSIMMLLDENASVTHISLLPKTY